MADNDNQCEEGQCNNPNSWTTIFVAEAEAALKGLKLNERMIDVAREAFNVCKDSNLTSDDLISIFNAAVAEALESISYDAFCTFSRLINNERDKLKKEENDE